MKNKNIIIIVIVALIILITLGIIFISQKATNKTGSTNLNPIEKQEKKMYYLNYKHNL